MRKTKGAGEQHAQFDRHPLQVMLVCWPLAALLLISTVLIGNGIKTVHAATTYNIDSRVAALDLRLPWQSGGAIISGYSYGCGDHDSSWDRYAIDFGLGKDTPVVAVFSGTMHIGQYESDGYGNNLWVSHVDNSGNTWRAVYAHLDSINTNLDGKTVLQGQVLGFSGNTGGSSTGYHLHFSLRLGGGATNYPYDGTSYPPEPMGGYTGFGHYGQTLDLLSGSQQTWPAITQCGSSPNQYQYTPGSPGGWWIGPTPPDYAASAPNWTMKINFRAADNGNGGLSKIQISTWTLNTGWVAVSTSSLKISPVSGHPDEEDAYTELTMPNAYMEVSVNVASNNGQYQNAPNGIRHYCPTLLQTGECSASDFTGDGSGSGGSGGGGPTSGVTVCTGINYTGTCQAFGVGTVSDLSQKGLSGNIQSILFNGAYTLFFNDGVNLSGTPGIFNASSPDLSTAGWANRAKSLKIEAENNVSCNVNGFTDGIILYRDSWFSPRGGCLTTSLDIPDLGPSTFNGFDGLQIVGDFQYHVLVSIYSQTNYSGLCGQYYVNQPDLGNCARIGLSVKIEAFTPPPQANNIASLAQRDRSGSDAVVDGDITSGWAAPDGKAQLAFGFSAPQTIQNITVFDQVAPANNNDLYMLEIVFSDGTVVHNLDMNPGGTDCIDVSFPAKSVSWVNILSQDGSGNGFGEIQIWDTSGTPYSQNNCVRKVTMTPTQGSGPVPVFPTPTPTPTSTPTATPTGTELLSSPWTLTGNNGAAEQDQPIAGSTLQGMQSVQVTFNLHGTSFGNGDDEASIVFVQSGDWRAANVIVNGGQNGLDGSQTLTIPLSAFHKVGDSSTLLDPTQPVSNLHARFWNTGAFTVDITSVLVQPTTASATPTPTPTSTPAPTATPTGVQPFIVYDEGLAANWGDWSWCSDNDFADTAHPNTGQYDIAWTVTCAYGGLALHLPSGFDTTGYTSLTFALGASQPGQTVQISLYDSSGNTGNPVQLDSYGGTPVAGQYTTYTIPISAFQSTGTITGILIQDITGNATEPPMYVDTIMFQ